MHLNTVESLIEHQAKQLKPVEIPIPDYTHDRPISLDQAAKVGNNRMAGPKGWTLAQLRQNPELREEVPDGILLPFGFFKKYAGQTGLTPLLDLLGKIDLKNEKLIAQVSHQIQSHIAEHPIPDLMMDEVLHEMAELAKRNGYDEGYHIRSDTNIEDLENFNGAGLNESAPNIQRKREAVQEGIQKSWASPFKEKSIFWRALALGKPTVTVAEPCVLIMATEKAQSSGVILTRGGPKWEKGKGSLSANWGIGSTVEAGAPTEEISFATGKTVRTGFTVSHLKPVANQNGGLSMEEVEPGTPVLTEEQSDGINRAAGKVDGALPHRSRGYDVEWLINQYGRRRIVQARPNM